MLYATSFIFFVNVCTGKRELLSVLLGMYIVTIKGNSILLFCSNVGHEVFVIASINTMSIKEMAPPAAR